MEFQLEMIEEHLDSLEHLPSAAYKEQKQQTCPHCRKAIEIVIVKLGSQADQGIETELQWNAMISWLIKFPPKMRLRLKSEHFEALHREKKALLHANCPRCQKLIPFVIQLRD